MVNSLYTMLYKYGECILYVTFRFFYSSYDKIGKIFLYFGAILIK